MDDPHTQGLPGRRSSGPRSLPHVEKRHIHAPVAIHVAELRPGRGAGENHQDGSAPLGADPLPPQRSVGSRQVAVVMQPVVRVATEDCDQRSPVAAAAVASAWNRAEHDVAVEAGAREPSSCGERAELGW